jgi:ribosomal-protein-alanine N-acetyltransferase
MTDSDIKRITSPILSSRRLILRPFTLDDAQALFSWSSDSEVTKFLRFSQHTSIQESRRIIQSWIDSEKHPPFFHWAIELREEVIVIGSIGIEIMSLHDNRGEIGYCLTRSSWNRGYATEALQCVLRFGLDVAGFHRLEACHSINNVASGRVMEKAGMVREAGPLKHYYRSDLEGYQDVYMYVALANGA